MVNERQSGGMALDLHIHDSDYIAYLLGMPKAVSSVGTMIEPGTVGHIMTQYQYDGNCSVFAEGSWLMQASFGFEMSFNIMLEQATIAYDCTREPAFRVCPKDGEEFSPDILPGDGYSNEINHFIKAVQGEETLAAVTPESSKESIRLIKAELESLKRNAPVSI